MLLSLSADDSFADSSDRKSWWFWLILDETYRIGVGHACEFLGLDGESIVSLNATVS
jgi:hypothetical protein